MSEEPANYITKTQKHKCKTDILWQFQCSCCNRNWQILNGEPTYYFYCPYCGTKAPIKEID